MVGRITVLIGLEGYHNHVLTIHPVLTKTGVYVPEYRSGDISRKLRWGFERISLEGFLIHQILVYRNPY